MASGIIAQPQKKTFNMTKWLVMAGMVLLLAAGVAGLYAWYFNTANGLPPLVDLAEFEETTGLQPKMIAVTAGGGIVDFRYKVVDPLIVERIMSSTQTSPRLLVADTGQVLDVGAHHILNEYIQGATYFMFYPNTKSAVKTGTEMWVIAENVRFGPIVAK